MFATPGDRQTSRRPTRGKSRRTIWARLGPRSTGGNSSRAERRSTRRMSYGEERRLPGHDQHRPRGHSADAWCAAGSYKVFVFGGSTIWGTGSPWRTGSPDWGTIPAYLQAGLAKRETRPVCVVNFGESAYVSSQSVIMLLTRLHAGDVPDLTLFYDGPNDVYAAFQSGRPTVHENVGSIARIFEHRGEAESNPLPELLDRS